jgi:HEPN domain-containing protein
MPPGVCNHLGAEALKIVEERWRRPPERRVGGCGLRSETEPWWRQAQADLRAADWNRQGGLYFVVTWLAQQAAEKGLKALYLERRGEEPPRTHAVQFLGRVLGVPDAVQMGLDALAPAFAQARYPQLGGQAPADAIAEDVAVAYVNAAGRVLAWIEGELQSR